MNSRSLVLALAVISCGGPAVQPNATAQTVASPRASFEGYHTFSFGPADRPPSGYEVSAHSLEVQRRLTGLVGSGLRKRGYVSGEGKTDLLVKLSTGTAGPVSADPEQRSATPPAMGFIGIDVYDSSTGTQVWQGTAFAEIDMEKIDDALLERGVRHMLATFPEKQARLE